MYQSKNFNGCTVIVWEWLSNFILHFIMQVIPYPCWDYNYYVLVKGFPEVFNMEGIIKTVFSKYL